MSTQNAIAALASALQMHPRVELAHTPTPIDSLNNVSAINQCQLFVKRDDCTGVGMGGNKIRQLEYYVGDAVSKQSDTLLITGAVQSNFTRSVAAVAAKLGMKCHVQLEQRVPNFSKQYRHSGNVLLTHLYGASVSYFPEGENEQGADQALSDIASELRQQGNKPYVIRLGAEHAPIGALGYVQAAIEYVQCAEHYAPIDEIVVASGSALTHIGLLFGLRTLGNRTKVTGVCVRRNAAQQTLRVRQRLHDLAHLLNMPNCVPEQDIILNDKALAPGYGRLSESTKLAIELFATQEGLLLDPVYTSKVADTTLQLTRTPAMRGKNVLIWHTGGQPAVFAYAD